MAETSLRELALEEQQHDATPRLAYGFELRRRDFFKLLGGGMVVLCAAPALPQESGARPHSDEDLPQSVSAWLHIAEDGNVTVYTGKVEMGQNIRTSLSQQVAEELRAPLDSIHLVMGDTALTPYDRGTFGSLTTPTMGPQLRNVAAAARENLIDLAAQRWSANRSALSAQNGRITDAHSGESISYGELTQGQALVQVIGDDRFWRSPPNGKLPEPQCSRWTGAISSRENINTPPTSRGPGCFMARSCEPPRSAPPSSPVTPRMPRRWHP